jgi:hypothetical protein
MELGGQRGGDSQAYCWREGFESSTKNIAVSGNWESGGREEIRSFWRLMGND